MKQLLEKTKLTGDMLAKIGNTTDHVGTAAPGRQAEQSSAENIAQPAATNDYSSALGQTLAQLLKRPELTIEQFAPVLRDLAPDFFHRDDARVGADALVCPAERSSAIAPSAALPLSSQTRNELKSIETEIKYAGYLHQQQRSIDRLKKAEQRSIPDWFDYRSVSGLSCEMQEKLLKIRPRTLGHASRIPGVTPAAVSLVNVYIEIQARRREQAAAL